MTQRKIHSVILIALMVISSFALLGSMEFNFNNPQELAIDENMLENDKLDQLDDKNDNNISPPVDAAYYKSLVFQDPRIIVDIEGRLGASYNNTYIMDGTENATHYFFTGYTVYSDTNRSLFVMQTTKTGSIERAVT